MTDLKFFDNEQDDDGSNDFNIEQYHLGWDDHKRGEIRPSHYPHRAEGIVFPEDKEYGRKSFAR